eukprot:tig00000411_g583.t1
MSSAQLELPAGSAPLPPPHPRLGIGTVGSALRILQPRHGAQQNAAEQPALPADAPPAAALPADEPAAAEAAGAEPADAAPDSSRPGAAAVRPSGFAFAANVVTQAGRAKKRAQLQLPVRPVAAEDAPAPAPQLSPPAAPGPGLAPSAPPPDPARPPLPQQPSFQLPQASPHSSVPGASPHALPSPGAPAPPPAYPSAQPAPPPPAAPQHARPSVPPVGPAAPAAAQYPSGYPPEAPVNPQPFPADPYGQAGPYPPIQGGYAGMPPIQYPSPYGAYPPAYPPYNPYNPYASPYGYASPYPYAPPPFPAPQPPSVSGGAFSEVSAMLEQQRRQLEAALARKAELSRRLKEVQAEEEAEANERLLAKAALTVDAAARRAQGPGGAPGQNGAVPPMELLVAQNMQMQNMLLQQASVPPALPYPYPSSGSGRCSQMMGGGAGGAAAPLAGRDGRRSVGLPGDEDEGDEKGSHGRSSSALGRGRGRTQSRAGRLWTDAARKAYDSVLLGDDDLGLADDIAAEEEERREERERREKKEADARINGPAAKKRRKALRRFRKGALAVFFASSLVRLIERIKVAERAFGKARTEARSWLRRNAKVHVLRILAEQSLDLSECQAPKEKAGLLGGLLGLSRARQEAGNEERLLKAKLWVRALLDTIDVSAGGDRELPPDLAKFIRVHLAGSRTVPPRKLLYACERRVVYGDPTPEIKALAKAELVTVSPRRKGKEAARPLPLTAAGALGGPGGPLAASRRPLVLTAHFLLTKILVSDLVLRPWDKLSGIAPGGVVAAIIYHIVRLALGETDEPEPSVASELLPGDRTGHLFERLESWLAEQQVS